MNSNTDNNKRKRLLNLVVIGTLIAFFGIPGSCLAGGLAMAVFVLSLLIPLILFIVAYAGSGSGNKDIRIISAIGIAVILIGSAGLFLLLALIFSNM